METNTYMLMLWMGLGVAAALNSNSLLWVDEYGVTRLVNLLDPSAPACELPIYPRVDIWPPTAMTFLESSKTVIACGGMNKDMDTLEFRNTKDCYTFDGTGEWVPGPSMPQYHCPYTHKTRNLNIPGLGWWIGGQGGIEGRGCSEEINTNDLMTEDGTWTSLDLESPYDQYDLAVGMCVVQLNATHTMVTGGWGDSNYTSQTYILNWETTEWTESAPMTKKRGYHGCGLTKDGEVIVVAGYDDMYNPTWTSEIFNPADGRWRYLGSVPKITAEFFKILPWQDTFVMLEWNTENIWSLQEDNTWTLLDVTMGGAFNADTDPVVMVPDDFVATC